MMVSVPDVDWSMTLVDLLNTTPVIDGVAHDLLGSDADAHAWLAGHGADGTEDPQRVRCLRDDLQAVVRGQADAAVLDAHLGGYVRRPRVDATGVHWVMQPDPDWIARIMLVWGDVQQRNPGRLRPCGNPDCRLFLLDRTRAGTARWCSMSVCGNRMKARRHYSRTTGR